jgi:hypothetical protein
MSTRINVNIDDGGLVDRNAQQQAAARQANQQRATAEKAAAEGQRQLEEERIRKGLDPDTGERLPSAGSSSRIQRIDQEPAANRRDALSVTRFYSRFEGNTRFFVSGDGTQEVAFTLPPPLTVPTFPVLENDTGFPLSPFVTPTSFRLLGQLDERFPLAFSEINPDTAVAWNDLTQAQDKRRLVRSKAFDITRSFPLGDGKAFIVRGRYFAYATVILRKSYSYTRFRDTRFPVDLIAKDTLNSQTLTVEIENNWTEQEDWVGVIVGNNSARQVTVPESLKEAVVKQSQDTEPVLLSLTSNVCVYAANNTAPNQEGNYDEGQFQCSGWPGTYGYEVYNTDLALRVPLILTVPSPLSDNRSPEVVPFSQETYGLTFDGSRFSDQFSTSPASWFNIDSETTNSRILEAETHEDLYAVRLANGGLFGQLFKAKFLVNLDEDGLRWNGPRLEGDVFTYPDSSNVNWKKGLKFTPRKPLEGALQPHYIYDWGQKVFCRQQANRYTL